MYEVITNWTSVIFLIVVFLLSLQISINSSKNIVFKLVNALISVLILITVIFVAQNKFIVERDAKMKAEIEFQNNMKSEDEASQLLADAKKEEESNTISMAMYKKEKKFVFKNIEAMLIRVKEIESIHESRYDTVLEEDYLFDKYRSKSLNAYNELNKIYSNLSKYNFESPLSTEKTKILRAAKLAKDAGKIYRQVFYKEQDVAYPKMIPSARKAKHSLLTLKKDLN